MISVSLKGFDEVMSKLKERKGSIDFNRIVDNVATECVDIVADRVSQSVGEYEGNPGTITYMIEPVGNDRRISVHGEKIAFIEFGYGTPAVMLPHPMDGWNGATAGAISDGEFGKHHWLSPPWYYAHGQKAEGMIPQRPIYDSAQYIRRNMHDIIKRAMQR